MRVDAHEPAPRSLDLAAEGVSGLRWWTLDELASTRCRSRRHAAGARRASCSSRARRPSRSTPASDALDRGRAARAARQEIVDAARELVERDGSSALAMRALAARVGVRAPSLDKHLPGKDELEARVVGRRSRRPGLRSLEQAQGLEGIARRVSPLRPSRVRT